MSLDPHNDRSEPVCILCGKPAGTTIAVKSAHEEQPRKVPICEAHGKLARAELSKLLVEHFRRDAADTLDFGAHKGERITEAPSAYLQWMVRHGHGLSEHWRARAEQVLAERGIRVPRQEEP